MSPGLVTTIALTILAAAAPRPVSPEGKAALSTVLGQVVKHLAIDCETPGLAGVVIVIEYQLDARGMVTSGPRVVGEPSSPVEAAAGRDARNALLAAQPFTGVPAELVNRTLRITFRPGAACASR